MIRQHDVQVLAEGTFRVVLTRNRRVVMAIDVPDSALGPLHLAFAVSPGMLAESTFATGGGLFGDLGHAFGSIARDAATVADRAAEGTFNAAAKVATTVARPAFDLTRDAAAVGASLVAHVPFVPEAERERIEAASRTFMRARLGDVTAQQFIRDVALAANAGFERARHAGDALVTGSQVVSRVLDAPLAQLSKIPAVGGVHALDPLVKLGHVAGAIQRGDFEALQKMVEDDVHPVADARAFIPGVATVGSAALSAGLAVLEGGGSLDVALHTAYGAIPIPPGLNRVTDEVLETVLGLVHHPRGVTDAALVAARSQVPSGFPRHVFDTLANLVVRHVPVTHAAQDLVGAYVQRYAPDLPGVAKGTASALETPQLTAPPTHRLPPRMPAAGNGAPL